MSKVIWNASDEELMGFAGGLEYTIKPDQKVKMPDSVANHLITQFGTRGLVSLEYGDTPEIEASKKEAALKRQEKFEKNQVWMYNRDNAKRKRQNLMWVEAPESVVKFAIKHGMKLEEEWTMRDVATEQVADAQHKAKLAEAKADKLSEQLLTMSAALEELMKDKISRDKLTKLDKRTSEYKELKEKLDTGGLENLVETEE